MVQTASAPAASPLNLRLGSALRLSDEELFELCRLNRELRIERTAAGDLEIMAPAGSESSHRNAQLTAALVAWAKRDGRGVIFDSSGGFLLPNGALRSPDAAWVLRSRLTGLAPERRSSFLALCPDFVAELRSPTDDPSHIEAKLREYLACGARLGWLIDPEARRVQVYRPGRPIEVLANPAALSGDPELPGLELDLGPIWEPLPDR